MTDSVREWQKLPDRSPTKEKISVSIDSDLVDRMDRLSEQTNRSRSNIINEALKRTLPLQN